MQRIVTDQSKIGLWQIRFMVALNLPGAFSNRLPVHKQ